MLYLASFETTITDGYIVSGGKRDFRLIEAESMSDAHVKLLEKVEIRNRVKLTKVQISEIIR